MQLPELITHDRDYKMLEAHKNGANYREIAKAFDVSPSTAHAGVKRASSREARRLQEDSPNIFYLVWERHESLIRELAPFARRQRVMDPDTNEEIVIPPSYDAVDRLLKIYAAQAKMMGLDSETININTSHAGQPEVAKDSGEAQTPEDYAKNIMSELMKFGAIDGPTSGLIADAMGIEVEDAEVVEDSEDPKLGGSLELTGPSLPTMMVDRSAHPEWVDDEDDEVEWLPEIQDPE